MPGMRPLPLRTALLAAALLLAIASALAWTGRNDGRLHLIVPVIPGDGLLVKSPDGRFILVDGGSDGTAVANWLGREFPLGRRTIDLMVGTRADATTLPGQLAAARRYRIGSALLIAPTRPDRTWDELLRLLAEQRAPVRLLDPGERLRLSTGARGSATVLEAVAHSDHVVMQLNHTSARILLLQSIADEPLPAWSTSVVPTVVVYPWLRSTDEPALRLIAPDAVVFGQRDGTDPQLTMAERSVGAARLLHEALDGRIDIAFDSGGIQLGTERPRVE